MSDPYPIVVQNKEELINIIPHSMANAISDAFKNGESVNDILGSREFIVDGQKFSKTVIQECKKQIEVIGQTCIRIINGSSIIYQQPEPPEIPETLEELKNIFADIVAIDKDKYKNIYDVSDLSQLQSNIDHVIDNVMELNTNFEMFRAAILADKQIDIGVE